MTGRSGEVGRPPKEARFTGARFTEARLAGPRKGRHRTWARRTAAHRTSPLLLGALLLGVSLAGACADGDASGAGTLHVDSAGVVLNSYEGADRPLRMQTAAAYTLGGRESGPESFYQLYPRWVDVGADGRIAVLHSQAYRVEVFDSSGAHSMSLGREGDGPGELASPSAVVVRHDGEVGVYDYRKRAVVRYAPDGTALDQLPLTVPFNGYQGMVGTADGLLLLSRTAPRGAGDVVQRVLHLTGTDTVQLGPSVITSAQAVQYPSCGMRITLPPLFAAEPLWASNGTRTAVVTGPEYSVLLFEGSRLARILRRPIGAEMVTPTVVERELGEGERWFAAGQECVVPPHEVTEARGHAALLPVVEALAVSPDGDVWVRRRVPASIERRIDLFDATGAYRGTLPGADAPFPVDFLPDGRVLTIETDALDLARVVVYRTEIGDGPP